MSNPPIVGSFMVGTQIFDAETLFKSLRALGLNIEASPEGIIVNGVLIKPDAKLGDNICPLAKVCERRAYFLSLVANKNINSNSNSFLKVEPEVEALLKTMDSLSEPSTKSGLDPSIFGINFSEEKNDKKQLMNDEMPLIQNSSPNSFLTGPSPSNNNWSHTSRNRLVDKDEEIVRKALKQIFSPQKRRKTEEYSKTDFTSSFDSLRKSCPSCGEYIPNEWDVCPSCGFIFR